MIALTWYRRKEDSRDGKGLRLLLDRDELSFALADAAPLSAVKSELPLICPATFRGDRRLIANVEAVTMFGADVDEPTGDPAAVLRAIHDALGGVEVFMYSTHSSEPGAFKLRALVPYDVPASGDEHRDSWALLARRLERCGVSIDRACSDPSRGYYVWSIPPSGAYYSAHLPGSPWPVREAAVAEKQRRAGADEQARRATRRPATSAASAPDRARRYVATMPPAISGAHGHDALWRAARAVVADFGLSDELALDVLREYSDRCQPPWSDRELRHKIKQAQSARVRREMGVRP